MPLAKLLFYLMIMSVLLTLLLGGLLRLVG